MSRKQIGIPGWISGVQTPMFGVSQPYAEFISKYGNLVILSPNDDIREDLDMLVLPGGADFMPSRFTDHISFYTGNHNSMLEHFDSIKLPEYLKMEIPMLSVCRGSQVLWAMMGGNIIQHNPYHTQSSYPTDECHELEWASPRLEQQFGKYIKYVNSRHHQSMDGRSNIPEDLEVLAVSKEVIHKREIIDNSIVEIFRHKKGHIYGYQGHPEDMPNDRLTPIIMKGLLNFDRIKQEELVETDVMS